MPLFHLSARALQRNERALGVVYVALLVLLVGGFTLAVVLGAVSRIVHAL